MYAGELAKDRNFDHILLIGNFHVSVFEQVIPSADMVQENSETLHARRKSLEGHLAALIENLKYGNSGHIIVSSVIAESVLVHSIAKVVASVKPELVIIGSKALESKEDNFVADQLVALIETISTPVMVVPARFKYIPISTAIVAANFKSFKNAGLLGRLKVLSNASAPKLLLLNANNDQTFEPVAGITLDNLKESLGNMLPGYEYEINNVGKHELVHGIFDFASRKRTEVIIALPEHHSLFYKLLHTTMLHKLNSFTYIPILILK